LGDLFEGKRTLMVIHLLREASGTDRQALVEFLSRDRAARSEGDVRQVLDLMVRHGSIDFAREFGEGIAAAADASFAEAFDHLSQTEDKAFISELSAWMLERPA
jgi:geranylgeranyl diphosphate synthase type II